MSPIYYLSILSSILLSSALGSLFCLIPAHNVLKEPFYWYEYQISIVIGVLPFVIWFVLIQAEYWAEFTIVDRWHSYLFAVFIGVPMYLIFISIYYSIWTYICDFTLPMPFSFYVGASITYSLTFYFLWFR